MAKAIMEINFLQKAMIGFVFTLLVGCGMAPGMRVESPPTRAWYQASQVKIDPQFVPITPELLASMPESKKDKYYYVGPQDVLAISVWDHPEFSAFGDSSNNIAMDAVGGGSSFAPMSGAGGVSSAASVSRGYLVNPDGKIFFPLIGLVDVQNQTTDEIRGHLATLLSKYVRNPQIDVQVTTFRSHRVFVIGEVNKPGLLNLNDIPMNVTDAIMLAGGINQDTADPSQIFVIRGDMLKPTVYWLNAKSANALLLGERFHLESNDIVFVSTTGVARWNRTISQIMPTVQTYFYTQTSIQQTRLN